MEFNDHRLDLNACRTRYRRAGSGPTLLFLHGAGGAESLLGLCGALAADFDVILPDHPGFGESDEPPWLDDVHDLAYHYLDFVTALGLSDVHLVGASLGGWVALEMMVRSSAHMASLGLIAATGIEPGDISCGDLFAWTPEEQVTRLVYDQALAQRILGLAKTPAQVAQGQRNEKTVEKLARDNAFTDPNLHHWLHRIDVPTLLVWGRNDELFPLAYGEKLAALIPDARLTVIDECGHLPHVEHPEPLRAALHAFVAEAGS